MNLPDTEQIDEQLTAYLDGELSPAEATVLEASLVDDEELRVRLAELRQAYDLLDEVPETPHHQRFTKSTLELVIKDISATATSKQPQASQTADLPKVPSQNRSPASMAKVAGSDLCFRGDWDACRLVACHDRIPSPTSRARSDRRSTRIEGRQGS